MKPYGGLSEDAWKLLMQLVYEEPVTMSVPTEAAKELLLVKLARTMLPIDMRQTMQTRVIVATSEGIAFLDKIYGAKREDKRVRYRRARLRRM